MGVRSQPEDLLASYWEKRSSSYYEHDVLGRRMIEAYLRRYRPESLIEVGCGTGELFPLFRGVKVVYGVDRSEGMLQKSKERIARHGYMNIQLKRMDITREHVLDFKFDLALTRTVLMHVPPSRIRRACKHLSKMSNRLLVFEYFDMYPSKPLAPHNWNHDYARFFEELNFNMVEAFDRPDGMHQILFVFERRVPETASSQA